MLGLGWNTVLGTAQRSSTVGQAVGSTLVRAAMLPAGTFVGLAFAALSVMALRRLPHSVDAQ